MQWLERLRVWVDTTSNEYWLTRFWFLRLLGFTYFFAYLSLFKQVLPLLGSNGLTPVDRVVGQEVTLSRFLDLPTVFWFAQSDAVLWSLALIGVILSFFLLIGFANVPIMVFLWFTYLSFVNVGQVWYGYGWEMQLVETGFLAIFMVPVWKPWPFTVKPSKIMAWLLRWLTMRVNLGSGLIKLRGASCWTDFTCLHRYFQTQPIPNPLSPLMHYLHPLLQKVGVGMTHFVQLLPPFGAFFETRWRSVRIWSGMLLLGLQGLLILTGNLSFLNWVTVAATISFFDDKALKTITPSFILSRLSDAKNSVTPMSAWRATTHVLLAVLVAMLSVPVVMNLLSSGQAMNTSYNDWNVVNTYGAFGSVRGERTELIVEGTASENLSRATWREYDFPAKPDQVSDGLPVIAPYQPRLAWQFWFASMSRPRAEPWLLHLTQDLLEGDKKTLSLVKDNPFSEDPPEHIRIVKYKYEYAPLLSNKTWQREKRGVWLPPVSDDDVELKLYLARRGLISG